VDGAVRTSRVNPLSGNKLCSPRHKKRQGQFAPVLFIITVIPLLTVFVSRSEKPVANLHRTQQATELHRQTAAKYQMARVLIRRLFVFAFLFFRK